MARLEGKVAIVTGAGGSIGARTVQLFLEEGAKVVLVDRSAPALERAAAELPSVTADRYVNVIADVAEVDDVRRYVTTALDRFGGIDILFSNAGNDGPILNVTDYPEEVFDLIQRVHVRGCFLACKYTIPHLPRGGRIIVTSSVVGVQGVRGNCAYVAAKHALIGLIRGIAKEVASKGITVNGVNPGPVDNEFMRAAEASMSRLLGIDAAEMFDRMIPMGRHAEPSEVARAVLFLASEDASFTTGSCLMVEGGMAA